MEMVGAPPHSELRIEADGSQTMDIDMHLTQLLSNMTIGGRWGSANIVSCIA